jgi:hypothetical protein
MSVFADTHATIKQLAAEGGMNERAAEILVTAINTGMGDNVATKSDIALVRADMAGIETRLSNKLYAVGLAMVGLIVTIQHIWK